jgi:hypothetical protein
MRLARGAGAPAAAGPQWRAQRLTPRSTGPARAPRGAPRRGLAVFAVAAPEKAPRQGPGRPSKQPYKKKEDEDMLEKGMRELPRVRAPPRRAA